MPKLISSVIICTRNRPNDIVTFLYSLVAQTSTPDELIIVDSSDTPLSQDPFFNQVIQKFNFGYTYVQSEPGLTLQRNKGIKVATGDIIYFFDDDVILEPDYLAIIQETFAQHPKYLGGMGTITNMQPKESWYWRVLRIFFLLHRDYASGNFTLSGMPTHAYGTSEFKKIEIVGGCCMAFRASAMQKHSFDENLTRYAYMEDCDISWRVSRDGSLFYQPSARLVHNNSPLARDKVVDNRAMFMRNYRYLYFKNVYPRNRLSLLAHWWSLLGLFLQALLIRDRDGIKGYVKSLCSNRIML